MDRSNSRGIPCAMAALAIALFSSTARAALVFEQVPDGTGNGLFSDGNIGINFYDQRIADNFTLSTGESITQIEWWGASEGFVSPDILLNTSAFVISFYANTGGLPIEPAVYTETIPIANITATPTGNMPFGSIEYLFSATLSAPVVIPAGMEHSLHIGALLVEPINGDAFAWQTAIADGLFSADFLPNDGTWQPQVGFDLAFRLFNAQAGGRCCLPSGDCIIAEEAACTTAGGTFGGDNTPCGNGSICRGRCCDPFGGCEVTGPVDCVAPSVFGGLGSNCNDPGVCAGRCCQPDGECTITGPGNCSLPDRFGGLGSTCADVREFGNPSPPTVVIVDAAPAEPSIINVPASFTIQDLDVRVRIQHTYRSDVVICLTAPGGAVTVALTDLASCTVGGICVGEDNLNAIFDDEGTAANCASANLSNLGNPPDRIFSGQSLSAFDGLNSAGDWTLQIVDDVGLDVGVLEDWSLLLDNGQACIGACCTGLSCTRVSSDACALAGGVYQGDTTTCSPTPCAPNGACCVNAGCSPQGQLDCAAAGGVYAGDGSTCASPVPCQASCCKPDGSCDLRTIASCNAIEGGFPGALGSSCPVGSCLGRCCTPGGTCSITVPELCTAPNTFGGLGTNCEGIQSFGNPNPPTVAIPTTGTQGAALPSVITVADNFPILDVDVRVKIQHTYRGDLILCLTGPGGGPTIQLSTGAGCAAGGDCAAEDNLNAVYDEEGAAINCASSNLADVNATPDHVIPGTSLSAFDGLPSAGDWTLNIFDQFGGDVGSLLEWELLLDNGIICQVGGCTCFGDMNGDTVVNGGDINAFANCVAGGGAGCPCGDMDHSGSATSADVTAFVTAVMTSTCGAPPP